MCVQLRPQRCALATEAKLHAEQAQEMLGVSCSITYSNMLVVPSVVAC